MKPAFSPGLDALESRELLSTFAPLTIDSTTYRRVAAGIVHAVAVLARTGNVERVEGLLQSLSMRLPDGPQRLLPFWRSDLSGFDRNQAGAAIATRMRLLRDLDSHVLTGVKQGEFRFVGPGSARFAFAGQGLPQQSGFFVVANQANIEIAITLTPKGGSSSETIRVRLDQGAKAYFTTSTFGRNYERLEIQASSSDGFGPVSSIMKSARRSGDWFSS
jgi:hypothetical protein